MIYSFFVWIVVKEQRDARDQQQHEIIDHEIVEDVMHGRDFILMQWDTMVGYDVLIEIYDYDLYYEAFFSLWTTNEDQGWSHKCYLCGHRLINVELWVFYHGFNQRWTLLSFS